MKIAVFGASGMLGREVVQAIAEREGLTPIPFTHAECEISDLADVRIRLELSKPSVIINCAGALPSKPNVALALANAAGPLVLAEGARRVGARLIHVSTDCVFSGRRGDAAGYEADAAVSPVDYYGLTKVAGEFLPAPAIVVRTSFIGLEHGLLRDLLDHAAAGDAEYPGWANALWNGSTAGIVARALVDIAEAPEITSGKLHLATRAAIDKATLLRMVTGAFNLRIKIVPVARPIINRALTPTIVLAPVSDGLKALAERWANAGPWDDPENWKPK